jgi:hypothetical protein
MSTEQTTAVVKTTPRDVRVVHDDSEISYLMDTARFDHLYRIAGGMARASLIPAHLKGATFEETQANCFLVVNQAMRWKLDPFAIAPETYAIGGKLAFQGKLVAAVINARGNLVERLTYTFNDKTGDALEVTVSGRLEGEDKPRTVTVTVGQARTQNQMWTKDPQQKLIYTGAIKWARRHKPEVILGVLTDDDAEAIRDEARFIAAAKVKTPEFEAGPVPIELEPGQPTPRARKKREMHPPAHDTAQQTPTPEVLPAEQVAANEAAEKSPAPTAPADELSFEQVVDGIEPGESDEIKQLREAMKVADVTADQILRFMDKNKYLTNAPGETPFLSHIKPEKLAPLIKALKAGQKNIIDAMKEN